MVQAVATRIKTRWSPAKNGFILFTRKSYQKYYFYASIFTMRFLGIDYGTKRIGIAISDEEMTLAFPKEIIKNDSKKLARLGEILENEDIGEIVIGESVNLKGILNPLSKEIETFIKELKDKFSIPVSKQSEFFTSVEARRGENAGKRVNPSQAHSKLPKKKMDSVDASAAALILQRYLDKKNKNL